MEDKARVGPELNSPDQSQGVEFTIDRQIDEGRMNGRRRRDAARPAPQGRRNGTSRKASNAMWTGSPKRPK